jgi:23S rRNA-/tRNA-specific pseudouridylate synthase
VRPRLDHRLDKDTSGILVLARTGQAANRLAEGFRDRGMEKLSWVGHRVMGIGKQTSRDGFCTTRSRSARLSF